jgi:membrane protease YdiL (CAAX protease family)
MSYTTTYKIIAILLPIALLITTGLAFYLLSKRFGSKRGYFLGFLFYWIVWCLFVPTIFLTRQEFKSLFEFNVYKFTEERFINLLCLIIPLLFAYVYAFPKALKSTTFKIILLSMALALVNATMEELLWRGFYLKLLGSDKWLYVLTSSFGFGIWHFTPQLVFPNKAPGGQFSFVVFAIILGIFFSIVVFNTKSILMVSICHIAFDFSGLGGRLYLSETIDTREEIT